LRAIIFSWEYPPRVVGKLAHYVQRLATKLVRRGVDVYVVTFHDYLTGCRKEQNGVITCRVSNPVRTHIGVLTWVLTLNQEVERVAADTYYDSEKQIDLIDVQDWHFIPAAVTLKKAFNLPFVYSVDSLEEHRSHGANSPFNLSIKSIEWLGTFESHKVVVKSEWMKNEVIRLYNVPANKIVVVEPEAEGWMDRILEVYRDAVGSQLSAGGSQP